MDTFSYIQNAHISAFLQAITGCHRMLTDRCLSDEHDKSEKALTIAEA